MVLLLGRRVLAHGPINYILTTSRCLDSNSSFNFPDNRSPSLSEDFPARNFPPRMDPPAPAGATATATVAGIEDGEWELCNDDGFVYKRPKRRRVADSDADTASGEASRPPDPVADERNRRERKRRVLMKLKRKYQREIEQWEILSNSLSAMREKADRFQMRTREQWRNAEETASFPEPSSGRAREQGEDASARPSLVEELDFMAEAQEAIIQDVSNLCEVAEEMCRVQEEQWKEPFFDLPVWGSPADLMESLCDD